MIRVPFRLLPIIFMFGSASASDDVDPISGTDGNRATCGLSRRLLIPAIFIGLACAFMAVSAQADEFATDTDILTIDFVTISATTNPVTGYGIVNNDYRMGICEVTNEQWSLFTASLGVAVTGSPQSAYEVGSGWPGASIPTTGVSWYEAAQFVNWLNTLSGNQVAYKFTGTQGQGDYTLDTWNAAEAAQATNLYRHKDAKYYLPTEDEWVKAAYWNGTELQTWATLDNAMPVAGADANYNSTEPWTVGSGCPELNGTFDMMGNVWEWLEGPWTGEPYTPDAPREVRGGAYNHNHEKLAVSYENLYTGPDGGHAALGFRIASEVPEPATLGFLALGAITAMRRRKI